MNSATKTPKLDLKNPFFHGDDQAASSDFPSVACSDAQDLSTWYVENARRQLADAFASAAERGVVCPTGYVAHPDQFMGLAFARELIGERIVRGRIDMSRPLIGCESRNVIACILLAVAAGSCKHLLDGAKDERGYASIVVLDRTCRVVHVEVAALLSATSIAPRSRRA